MPSEPLAVAVNLVVAVRGGDVQLPCGKAHGCPEHPPLSIERDATLVVLQVNVTLSPELMLVLSAEKVSVGVFDVGGGEDGGVLGGVVGVLPPVVAPLELGPPHALKSRTRKIKLADTKPLKPFDILNEPSVLVAPAKCCITNEGLRGRGPSK